MLRQATHKLGGWRPNGGGHYVNMREFAARGGPAGTQWATPFAPHVCGVVVGGWGGPGRQPLGWGWGPLAPCWHGGGPNSPLPSGVRVDAQPQPPSIPHSSRLSRAQRSRGVSPRPRPHPQGSGAAGQPPASMCGVAHAGAGQPPANGRILHAMREGLSKGASRRPCVPPPPPAGPALTCSSRAA